MIVCPLCKKDYSDPYVFRALTDPQLLGVRGEQRESRLCPCGSRISHPAAVVQRLVTSVVRNDVILDEGADLWEVFFVRPPTPPELLVQIEARAAASASLVKRWKFESTQSMNVVMLKVPTRTGDLSGIRFAGDLDLQALCESVECSEPDAWAALGDFLIEREVFVSPSISDVVYWAEDHLTSLGVELPRRYGVWCGDPSTSGGGGWKPVLNKAVGVSFVTTRAEAERAASRPQGWKGAMFSRFEVDREPDVADPLATPTRGEAAVLRDVVQREMAYRRPERPLQTCYDLGWLFRKPLRPANDSSAKLTVSKEGLRALARFDEKEEKRLAAKALRRKGKVTHG